MSEAPNQKVLLVGFAVAFVAVALVLFLMLRGGGDEAAAPGNASGEKAGSGPRPSYKAPTNMRPNQVQRAIDVNPQPAPSQPAN